MKRDYATLYECDRCGERSFKSARPLTATPIHTHCPRSGQKRRHRPVGTPRGWS